jgi:hypothetical protein
MLEVLSAYFLNPIGIFALFAIPIVLIIYFLKKKTVQTYLPSMMFLLSEQGKKKYKWFPRIPFNWLLLVHILLVLAISAAILEPYIWTSQSATSEHTIIILDNSASMQTANRFDAAKQDAISKLGLKNTIIVTSPKPIILAKDANYLTARNVITAQKVTDAPTPLLETLAYTQSLNLQAGTMHIFSDFIPTTQGDVFNGMAKLRSNVIIPHLYTQGKNTLGFIDLKITEQNATFVVKNFENTPVDATLIIGQQRQDLRLAPLDVATITIPTPTERLTLRLTPNDEFMADNILYIVPSQKPQKSALYFTNSPNVYTQTALSVIDFVTYNTHAPPGYANAEGYSIFIFENVETDKILPSNIDDALDAVHNGGVMIIKISDRMRTFPQNEAFPYIQINPKTTGTIELVPSEYTKGLTASSKEDVYTIVPRNDTIPLIVSNGQQVVSYRKHGQGIIVYYGINDENFEGRFRETYAFPILMQRLMKGVFVIPEIYETHQKTGSTVFGIGTAQIEQTKETIQLPYVTERVGHINVNGVIYAINHIHPDESIVTNHLDINEIPTLFENAPAKFELTKFIAALIIILLLLELYVMRRRGNYHD